ncbi:MAG: ATP-binding protein [Alphaproteobacteria bacterium]|nr:ATP-binding protein [Alphaproteobacteria bacterium]
MDLVLVGDGITPGRLAEVADQVKAHVGAGMAVAAANGRSTPPAAADRRLLIASPERVALALDGGERWICEDGMAPAWSERLAAVFAHGRSPLFAWCVRSSTAYGVPIVDPLARHLVARGVLSEASAWAFKAGLTEAIANACIHGNLEIDNRDRVDPWRFSIFVETVHLRLTDPRYGGRGIMVVLTPDESGLCAELWQECGRIPLSAAEARLPTADRPAGRGMALMAAVAKSVDVLADGRCVRLVFPL